MAGRVLVTGSSGSVGRAVVTYLRARGATVRTTVRPGKGRGGTEGCESAEFDFEHPSTFGAALEGVDRVFFVRPPHMSDPKSFQPFIAAMVSARVKQVVFLSVQGAGQNIFVPHHGIEVLLKRSGLPWTFLRPSFFMQNLTTTHRADIQDRDEIFVPAGTGRTNFIDVDDIGEVAAICLTEPGHEGKAYEITGSEALTYAEVASILSQACGRDIVYSRPSAKRFKSHMKRLGHDDAYVDVMGSIYAVARFGLAAGTTDTFERLVGRKPRTFCEWAALNVSCWERIVSTK